MTNYIIQEEKLFGRRPSSESTPQSVAVKPSFTESSTSESNPSQDPSQSPSQDPSLVRRDGYRAELPRPRRGCSVALFWFSVIYWFFSILCCAGALFIGWELGNTVREGISENPVEIREETSRFFGTIDLPPQFKPAMSLTFKQPFSGTPVFFGAVYTYSNPERERAFSDVITVGIFSSYLSEELRSTFQERLSTQIAINATTKSVVEQTTIPVLIGGRHYKFESVLTQTTAGHQLRTVSGLFRNKSGEPAFILLSVDPQTVSARQINTILQSLNQ